MAMCPFIYDPVVGCDGIQYGNSCQAEAAGVTSYTDSMGNQTMLDWIVMKIQLLLILSY